MTFDAFPVFKRKFRWVVEFFKGEEVLLPPTFAKVLARPQEEGNNVTLTFFDCDLTKWSFLGEIKVEDHCKCILTLYDGCGTELESWTLMNVTVQDANFVEYSEASTEPSDIELFLKYSESVYKAASPPFKNIPIPIFRVPVATPPCTCECHKVTCNCTCSKFRPGMGIGLLGDPNIIF